MVLMTGMGWTVWLYLWRPLLTLVLWLFGADLAHYQWISLHGWEGLLDFIFHTMPYGWALCATLLIWASINYLRFHGMERRKARPLATVETDAKWTLTSPETLANGRRLKTLVCHHDDDGHLIDVSEGGSHSSSITCKRRNLREDKEVTDTTEQVCTEQQ